MSGPVVVGVDGSSSSLAAVEAAAWEAGRRGTRLRLAYALGWPSAHVPPGVPPWDPDGAGLRELVNGSLTEAERRARGVAPRVTITRDVLVGEPAAVLESESRTASLTVVGGRPVTRAVGLPRDSVAGRLTAHGRCPVLVVRGRPARSGPVLLADESQAAAEFAFSEASERGADLVLLHPRAGTARPPAGPLLRLREQYPDVTVRERWVRGRAAWALVDASVGAQLLVIAARRGAAAVLPASACRAVMAHAHCPVAVVPSGEV